MKTAHPPADTKRSYASAPSADGEFAHARQLIDVFVWAKDPFFRPRLLQAIEQCRAQLAAGSPCRTREYETFAAYKFSVTPWNLVSAPEVAQLFRDYVAKGELRLNSELEPNAPDLTRGAVPLELAIRRGNVEAAVEYIRSGADTSRVPVLQPDFGILRFIRETVPGEPGVAFVRAVSAVMSELAASSAAPSAASPAASSAAPAAVTPLLQTPTPLEPGPDSPGSPSPAGTRRRFRPG